MVANIYDSNVFRNSDFSNLKVPYVGYGKCRLCKQHNLRSGNSRDETCCDAQCWTPERIKNSWGFNSHQNEAPKSMCHSAYLLPFLLAPVP